MKTSWVKGGEEEDRMERMKEREKDKHAGHGERERERKRDKTGRMTGHTDIPGEKRRRRRGGGWC